MTFMIFYFLLDALDYLVEESGIVPFFSSLQNGSFPQVCSASGTLFIHLKQEKCSKNTQQGSSSVRMFGNLQVLLFALSLL